MKLSESDHARIDRLASEKKGGGGLVLPSLFSALMNELLDNKVATDERLAEVVAAEAASKTQKLAETWNGDWAYLTADLMDSLAVRELVARKGKKWVVGPKFQAGIRMEVLPARKGLNEAQGFFAWDQDTRADLSKASAADFKFRETLRQPRLLGSTRGRTHGPEVMKALRESWQREGPLNPVLVAVVDGEEVVIDGRHRLQIDPQWPKKILSHVTTRDQAIAAVLEVDSFARNAALPDRSVKVLQGMVGQFGAAPTQSAIKRALVERELLEDASRSNRAIAELTGVSAPFVIGVRDELVNGLQVHRYEFTTAKTGKHSTDCWCGEGDYTPKQPEPRQPAKKEDPALVNAAEKRIANGESCAPLAEEFGVSRQTVDRAVDRAEGRIEGRAKALKELAATECVCPNCGHQWVMDNPGD